MTVRDNEIDCVLFDQCASDVCFSQNQNSDTNTKIVSVVNLGRISWSKQSEFDGFLTSLAGY